MYDFLEVKKEYVAKLQRYVYRPAFVLRPKIKDLMTRSGFYALFNPYTNFWTKDREEAIELIDRQVYEYVLKDVGETAINDVEHGPVIKRIADTENGLINKFILFCKDQMTTNYIPLDQKIIFSNQEVKRTDYVSQKLPYPMMDVPTPYFDKFMGRIFPPADEEKVEWSIGCFLANEQRKIQKFFVLFGPPGSGKSTLIDKIIVNSILDQKEADDEDVVAFNDRAVYASKFTAHLLASKDSFATDFLASDPIVAFDDDADLSNVVDKATLNVIISHEPVRVNQKNVKPYNVRPNCLLYMGTNEAVQLSPESGLIRRLIDIRQTGEKLPYEEYEECIAQFKFERPGIAWKCYNVYKKLGRHYYDKYRPEDMLSMTSPFHNFVKDSVIDIHRGTSLANAYKLYENYAETSNLKTTLVRYKFRDQLKGYFDTYDDSLDENGHARNYFSGFKYEKVGMKDPNVKPEEPVDNFMNPPETGWLHFEDVEDSMFDILHEKNKAQYAFFNEEKNGWQPRNAWDKVTTVLSDLEAKEVHYVKLDEDEIFIDFDIKDENGEKSLEKNLEAANKFPPTYAETSMSGKGIHLHYIWKGGDPSELSSVYGDNIEIKVTKGNSSLRRKLGKCNNLPIAVLSSGLPLKGGSKSTMPTLDGVMNERILRYRIEKNLRKGYHPNTKPSIDYIEKLLLDAYNSGMSYDLRDYINPVMAFAHTSSHQAEYCVNRVGFMHFTGKDFKEPDENYIYEEDAPIAFYDVEVFPNLFINCWKYESPDTWDDIQKVGVREWVRKEVKNVFKMINPNSKEIQELFNLRLIGFNNRKYDNHIIFARSEGYTNEELYSLSGRIISGDKNAFFRSAYNLSYTDVYDYSSAANKKSLKKWEIELHGSHLENEYPWDQPVPEDKWIEIAEYCANDVVMTEVVHKKLQADFLARKILADIAGLSVNDTTNTLTTKIICGDVKNPQKDYIYTDLSTIYPGYKYDRNGINRELYLPNAKIVRGKSFYRGEDPGEGGYAIGYPGIYENVALLDVASMHPHSAIRLKIFGEVITKRFEELVEARVFIKHGDFESASKMLDGKLAPYLKEKSDAKMLADALKTAINSVYGLTSAAFDNKLRDPRNIDNIVAKYGALFMINLKHEIQDRGFKVVHIKTDSIKIANATPDIIAFAMDYAKQYGYTFEHEATYDRICLLNDAVYIAKYASKERCEELYGYCPGDNEKKSGKWTATGDQFKVPYVFKTMFSKEPIEFYDMCETFSVQTALYLDMNEENEDEHRYEFVGRIGEFTPVKPGFGGGRLLRKSTDKNGNEKYDSANGAKGYRWIESISAENYILENGNDDLIDRNYYRALVDKARQAMIEASETYNGTSLSVDDFCNDVD